MMVCWASSWTPLPALPLPVTHGHHNDTCVSQVGVKGHVAALAQSGLLPCPFVFPLEHVAASAILVLAVAAACPWPAPLSLVAAAVAALVLATFGLTQPAGASARLASSAILAYVANALHHLATSSHGRWAKGNARSASEGVNFQALNFQVNR